jgi:transposase
LADKGYDADWLREALADRKIAACIPSKSNRKIQITRDRLPYRKGHKIENMFGKLKDWRRIHTRYDRCATPSCQTSLSLQLSSSGYDQ